ncbi:transcriptional regulator [Paenisporosarcina sp.]|uniref:transcriptional regulator n=1 Tax=Paenisporosarcina sp. TaxID=1932001 RepID=UPI003C70BEAA
MLIKIAVIGSADFLIRIKSISTQITGIQIDEYLYQEPQEAIQLVKTINPCDVVFFSGALPYYFSKEWITQLPIPTHYLPQDEMSVATTLLAVIYQKQVVLTRISIDLMDASFVTNVLADIECDDQIVHIMDYQDMLENHFDLNRLITYHQTLWTEGKIDLAITSIHAVYDQLQQLGVPVMRMTNPRSTLIRGLHDAKTKAQLVQRQSAKVAVGRIYSNELHELKRGKVDAIAHRIDATIKQVKPNLYALYSTQGKIEDLINHHMLHDFFENDQEHIKIGFGYGETIFEADQNSEIALHFAKKEGEESCAYILTEEKELSGPFPQEYKQQRLVIDRPDFLKMAKQTTLSPANLSKIIQFGQIKNARHFTAVDLANYLKVTRRSTERILKKLADHGFVLVVGEEMTYQQGRPRAIYQLNILIYK